MGCIRRTVWVAAAMLPACGALNDISDMNREVKNTNQSMTELLTLYKGTDQKLTDSLAEVKKSNANLSEQLAYSKSMETSLEATLGGIRQMLESMNSVVEQGKLTTTQLQATVDQLHLMLAKLNAASDTLDALLAQGSGNDKRLGSLVELTQDLKTLMSGMLSAVGSQKTSILADKMRDFAANVSNVKLPNDFRVASAIVVFNQLDENEAILDQSVGGVAGWYMTWVAANVETCRPRIGRARGDVCNQLFLGTLGEILHPPLDEVSSDLREVMEARPALIDLVPLPRFRTNFVWALALAPSSVDKFYKFVVSDRSKPLARKGRSFLIVARRMSIEFLSSLVQQETSKHPLDTQDLTTVLQRIQVVQAIQRLPEMNDVRAARDLAGILQKFLNAVDRRSAPLSSVDQKLVDEIGGHTTHSSSGATQQVPVPQQ